MRWQWSISGPVLVVLGAVLVVVLASFLEATETSTTPTAHARCVDAGVVVWEQDVTCSTYDAGLWRFYAAQTRRSTGRGSSYTTCKLDTVVATISAPCVVTPLAEK